MEGNYGLLISKINEFSRKFYLNQLLRGTLYTAALLLALYVILFLSVYYLHPAVLVKTLLFFSFWGIAAIAIIYWILRPILTLLKLRKTQSLEEAATLIGQHFFHVKDKLLNTLQLKALADQHPGNSQLILAGIDQKIQELKPVPFSSAIHLSDNKKYLKYLVIPLAIILFISFIAPSILREGTSSFVKYNQEILPEAPFSFILLQKELQSTQGEDYTLNLSLQGDLLPQEVYIMSGLNTYKLEKQSISRFQYTFKNLQKDLEFHFSAGGFNSRKYNILVKPRPSLLQLSASLHYPSYLGKKEEKNTNVGDLIVPEGTFISWSIGTEHTDHVQFNLDHKTFRLPVFENQSVFRAQLRNSTTYQVSPENTQNRGTDAIGYSITVIKDLFPEISVTESPDSTSNKALYFTGKVSDDHGFSALTFHYHILENGKIKKAISKTISFQKNQAQSSFFYFWSLKDAAFQPGQTLEYYFEVADNDGVNGPKSSKSAIKTLLVPTAQQTAAKTDQSSNALKQKMENAIKLAGQVEKESKKLGETLLDKKEITLEDKKQIEQLLDKQKQLDQSVQEIKKLNTQQTFEKEENNLLKDELLKKQQQIDDLFNNALDEKTKSILEKLQNLMNESNKDKTSGELSKMQMDNKSLKNELDRILELYKQLEFEQNLQNKTDRLEELAKMQEALSKQSAQKNADLEDLKKKQTNISKELTGLKKEFQQLDEKNRQLEKPNPFQRPDKEISQIESSQKVAQDQLSKSDRPNASKSQEKAAEELKKLSQKLKEEQQEASETENNINAQEIRKLLQNLLNTSFEQEKVMLRLRNMNSTDPQYTLNVQKQRTIKDNMKTISDSLFSLSKRVPQISSTVNEEVQKINFNMDKSLDKLGDRQTYAANENQQYAMTSINNLSLMLNEALEQLQKMKNSSGSGKGKKQQSLQQLQKMQQQLNSNMQKAREQLEKAGNKGTVPKGVMSQEIGKMAQQQQMIREALEKINREDNKDGKGKLGNLNQMIQDMKQTEEDLVNKRIEQETIRRQRDLLTKMLDAEKAERQQDEDAKRESKAGKDFPPSYPKMLEKFRLQQRNEQDILQKLPPDLNYYYKNKISDYFKLLNSAP